MKKRLSAYQNAYLLNSLSTVSPEREWQTFNEIISGTFPKHIKSNCPSCVWAGASRHCPHLEFFPRLLPGVNWGVHLHCLKNPCTKLSWRRTQGWLAPKWENHSTTAELSPARLSHPGHIPPGENSEVSFAWLMLDFTQAFLGKSKVPT